MYSLEAILVPISWFYVFAFGFGVIVGSFLNVVIYRYHTGKSLNGSSHCLSCGRDLKWYELFPLLSYLALRGRCRTCGCKITPRYFLVELATGILFALGLLITLDVPMLVLLWVMFSILVVITVYDINHFIIPDRLTLALLGLVLLMIGYEQFLAPISYAALLWQLFAAVCGSAFFLFLWVISKGQWLGFGDVKLSFPLSLLVGTTKVFSFVVLSFWIGAIISLLIIGYQKLKRGKESLHLDARTITMKSAVPFAPFLVASSLVILFTHFDVLELFSFT
jgi:leader peptidase (prepilin peptidase)/N-methyltransferase